MEKAAVPQRINDSAISQTIEAGLARFSEILRDRDVYQSVEDWSYWILENLVEYVNGLQAAMYLTPESEPNQLVIAGTYGIDLSAVQKQLAWGEGLVGQAAKSGRRFLLQQNGSMEVEATTGLGKLKPRMLIIQPLISEERVEGVLEISSLYTFDLTQREFINRLATSIAASISSIRSQEEMNRLYHHAQEQERIVKETNANLDLLVARRTKELERALFELEAAQQQLVHNEKMASLGQLIAGVAHEINTPIGAIKASAVNVQDLLPFLVKELPKFSRQLSDAEIELFTNLMEISMNASRNMTSREERAIRKKHEQALSEAGMPEAEDVARKFVDVGIYCELSPFIPLLLQTKVEILSEMLYRMGQLKVNLDNIIIAADKTKRTVFALKSYVHKQDTDKPEANNLKESLDVILTLYHNQLKYGVEVSTDIEVDAFVLCNPDEVGQIWTNMIHNAVQAMNNKGKLHIAMKKENHSVTVTFTDNGPGIPEEIQKRIFEPFFTTKPKGEGTGLGLSICQDIAKKYNGKITLASIPGETTFTITFPLFKA